MTADGVYMMYMMHVHMCTHGPPSSEARSRGKTSKTPVYLYLGTKRAGSCKARYSDKALRGAPALFEGAAGALPRDERRFGARPLRTSVLLPPLTPIPTALRALAAANTHMSATGRNDAESAAVEAMLGFDGGGGGGEEEEEEGAEAALVSMASGENGTAVVRPPHAP